jgi:uncharacterized protein (DUF697 family)/GTP-binding protein EngB required for normal cell division
MLDMGMDLNPLLDAAIEKAKRDLGKINVLVAGLSGVGKSTLINAVFGQTVAITGIGFGQTQSIKSHEVADSPLRIYDTKGFEIANAEATVGAVKHCIQDLRKSPEVNDQIHLTWTCILEQSHRIEPVHRDLLSMLGAFHIPSVVVITQSLGQEEMERAVRKLAVPNDAVVPVLAAPIVIAGHTIPAQGLEELVRASMQLVPQAHRAAFIAAQTASWDLKKEEVTNIINRNAALAAGSAFLPFPGGHSVALIGLQVALIAQINMILGISVSDTGSKEIAKGLAGIAFAKVGGTLAFTEAMKFVPGIGWAGAAMIGGPIGATATKLFGHLYYDTVVEYAQRKLPLPPSEILTGKIKQTLEGRDGYYDSLTKEFK